MVLTGKVNSLCVLVINLIRILTNRVFALGFLVPLNACVCRSIFPGALASSDLLSGRHLEPPVGGHGGRCHRLRPFVDK